MAADLPIGIDLGTHNTRAACVRDGVPVLIPDQWGNPLHASVVSFLQDGRVLLGQQAREQLTSAPRSTVFATKRLIGRQFFSEDVKRALATLPYEIVEGPDHSVRVVVNGQAYEVPEISALLVKEIKARAKQQLGAEVTHGLVTVPAWFNQRQRTATMDTLRRAGLQPLDVLEETTAAVRAYDLQGDAAKHVVVFELSGEACNISVLEVSKQSYRVLAAASDPHLGGADFDERILTFVADQFQQQHGVDLRDDGPALRRLRAAAEHAKNTLSGADSAHIHIPLIHGDADVDLQLPRTQFDRMVLDMLQRSFKLCDEAVRTAQLTAPQVDHVILVGGPTRLPIIRNGLRRYFQKEPLDSIDPRLVVAIGAARHAHSLLQPDGTVIQPTPRPLLDDEALEDRAPAADAAAARRVQTLSVLVSNVEDMITAQTARKEELETLTARWSSITEQAQQARQVVEQFNRMQQAIPSLRNALGGAEKQLQVLEQWHTKLQHHATVLAGQEQRLTAAASEGEKSAQQLGAQLEQVKLFQQGLGEWTRLQQVMLEKVARVEERQEAVNAQGQALEAMEARLAQRHEALKITEAQHAEFGQLKDLMAHVSRDLPALSSTREELSAEVRKLLALRDEMIAGVKQAHGVSTQTAARVAEMEQKSQAIQSVLQTAQQHMARHEKDAAQLQTLAASIQEELGDLRIRHDELRDRATLLDAVQERLDAVQGSIEKTETQLSHLDNLHVSIQQKHQELGKWEAVRADTERLRINVIDERKALEATLARAHAFSASMPTLLAKMDVLQGRIAELEGAMRTAADVDSLRKDLADHLAALEGQRKAMDALDERMGALGTLHANVERVFGEQTHRLAELEAMRGHVDALAIQLESAAQQMDELQAARDRLAPLPERVDALRTDVEKTQTRLDSLKLDGDALHAQEERLKALVAKEQEQAGLLEERTKQLQRLGEELTRLSSLRQEVLQGLAEAREQQRELGTRMDGGGEQLARLERLVRQVEERHGYLVAASERMERHQAALEELKVLAESADIQMQTVLQRLSIVEGTRKAVDEMLRLKERAEESVAAAEKRMDDVNTVRSAVTDVQATMAAVRKDLKELEDRRSLVDQVRQEAKDAIALSEDVADKLEHLVEQQVSVELAVEKVGELRVLLEDSHNVIKLLQKERLLSDRIQSAIKQLRGKDGRDDGAE